MMKLRTVIACVYTILFIGFLVPYGQQISHYGTYAFTESHFFNEVAFALMVYPVILGVAGVIFVWMLKFDGDDIDYCYEKLWEIEKQKVSGEVTDQVLEEQWRKKHRRWRI